MKDNCYYLYEIAYENNLIPGLVIKITSSSSIIKKIRPHEEIDHQKKEIFIQQIKSNISQKSPIILGVLEEDFEINLRSYKNTTPRNINSNEAFFEISAEHYPAIQREIAKISNLFLVDGHHRLYAFQELNQDIVAWIVPLNKLHINTFVKVFYAQFSNNFFEKLGSLLPIHPHHSLELSDSEKKINLFSNGVYYQIKPTHDNFLSTLRLIHSLLANENSSLESIYEYRNEILANITSKYNTNHLIIVNSPLMHSETFSNSYQQLLPVHTTCFKPKPIQNSLYLLASLEEKEIIC